MTPTGSAPATSELALAYNGANYKITKQNLVDSGGTYSASIYLWTKTMYQANGVFNTWLAQFGNDTTKYQDVNPNKNYYFVDTLPDAYNVTMEGNILINRITDSWLATYGSTSSITNPIVGGAVHIHGTTTPTNNCWAHYAFIRNNRLYLYAGCTNALPTPLMLLEV